MGQDLIQSSAVFRSTMERLQDETGIPLVPLYEDGTQWTLKFNSAIGITSFQLGIIAVLAEQGIRPDHFLGHSLGELPCAYLAGLQTEAEVLLAANVRAELVKLIEKQARLDVYCSRPIDGWDYEIVLSSGGKQYVRKVPADGPYHEDIIDSYPMAGKMVVVGCEAEAIDAGISELALEQTCVACYNSPKGQTISGPEAEVDKLVKYLTGKNSNLFVRSIDTDNIAYHAPYLKVFRGYLRSRFRNIDPQPLPVSWKTTSRSNTFGKDYLIDNICRPVFFCDAIESLPPNATVVEIGPASGLLSQIKRTRKDLGLISLIRAGQPVDLEKAMAPLKPWMSKTETLPEEIPTGESALHYSERYPEIWGRHTQFPLPKWTSFEKFQKEFSTVSEVSYDLSQSPWSSIRDHTLRGQNLFPAAGFLHVLWSANSYEKCTEIKDFRIIAPSVIPKGDKEVRFLLHCTGQYCEVWDADNETCHASGHVRPAETPRTRLNSELSPEKVTEALDKSLDSKYWYSGSDNFGPKYRLLDKITGGYSTLKTDVTDFIAYVDAFFQQLSATERDIPADYSADHVVPFDIDQAVSFPRGADRVVFWKTNLESADRWLQVQGYNSVGNTAVTIEGYRKEFARVIPRPPAVYSETFVEYRESDCALEPAIAAAVLLRESLEYSVVHPIVSAELDAVLQAMRKYPLSKETDTCTTLVFSDDFTEDASLLVTAASILEKATVQCTLVAKWGELRLYRIGLVPPMKVVNEWKSVPESDPFIWKGDGSAGAAASLFMERNQQVLSYPSSSMPTMVGLEKGMRQNFLLESEHQCQHGVWVDVQHDDETSEMMTTSSAQLRIAKPGVLNSLEWHPIHPEMYPIKVAIASLNFRDIMRAMGMLKEQNLSLGFEFSGFHILKKQRVFGLSLGAIASYCYPTYTYPTPEYLSDEEAATIPLVYLTAYYAMFEKANMTEGQSVLIHAGTGGVGMAAINLAQKRGLKIFTTCSAPKRDFLKKTFGLKDEQIGDSRCDAFVNTVLDGTAGRGVDVVINHLAGHLQIASLRCLAPGGQFCEIGKYDIANNSPLGQGLLAMNVSFHVIDLLLVPDFKSFGDKWLSEGFGKGEIAPLPTTPFDASEIVAAFRYMSQGRHIGKIVIQNLHQFQVRHLPLTLWKESHLITGGLGGLGMALAFRLACHGSRKFLLVGRRGVTNSVQRFTISQMEALGCQVHVLQANVVDLTPNMCTFQPDRIWHVATVYRDVTFSKMTDDHWDDVVRTKVEGYHHMRQCWPVTPLVNISSVSGYFGNVGQTNYAFANSSLDAAARRDPNTLTVRLGTLDNVGYVVENESNRRVLELSPFELMPISDVLNRIEQVVSESSNGVVSIYNLKPRMTKSGGTSVRSGPYTLLDAQSMLANVLGGQPEQYYPTLALKATGLDSLSLMEVVHHIYEETGARDFKPQEVDEDFTVQDLVDVVVSLRVKHNVSNEGPQDAAATVVPESLPSDPAAGKVSTQEASETSFTKAIESSDASTRTDDGIFVPQNKEGSPDLPMADTTFDESDVTDQDLTSGWSTERKSFAGLSVLASAWFVITLVASGTGNAESIVLYASVVANACLVVYHAIKILAPYVRDPISCAHYATSILESIVYAILYAVGYEVFVDYWKALVLGRYLMDMIFILPCWEDLVVDYRRFYLIHHILAFFTIGSWTLFPSEDQVWDENWTLGVMLWLASPIWLSIVMTLRYLFGPYMSAQLKMTGLPFVSAAAFAMERIQRLIVYIFVGVTTEVDYTSYLMQVVFLTGLLMDSVDIYFQQKMIRQQFTALRRARDFSRHVEAMLPVDDLESGRGL